MTHDRRTFLKRSGAALSAAAVGSSIPDRVSAKGPTPRRLDPGLLHAVAEVVLPEELGEAGFEEATAAFVAWADAYEPVAERNHGYGTSEIRYGPPDPVPGWTAQLEALEIEAHRREGRAFTDLSPPERRALIERQPLDAEAGLPDPLFAQHVVVALMAHWYRSPEAVDRCYGRRIAERSCRRGIDTAPNEPEVVR